MKFENQVIIIKLDKQTRHVTAGEDIKGKIVVQNVTPEKINQLTIRVIGKGKVDFWESPSHIELAPEITRETYKRSYRHIRARLQITRWNHYTAEQDFKSKKIILAGDSYSGKNLPDSTYPFSIRLSRKLPATLDHENCSISYHLKAELENSDNASLHSELPIMVGGFLDLNRIVPMAGQPQIVGGATTLEWLSMKVTMSMSGFVPGENLKFSCAVRNKCKSACLLTAALVQITRARSKERVKEFESIIFEIKAPPVAEADIEYVTWKPANLIIPPLLTPTRIGGTCNLIDVQYCLKFKACVSKIFDCEVSQKVPIIIGTKPIVAMKQEIDSSKSSTSSTTSAEMSD